MAFARWDPFRDLLILRDQLDRMQGGRAGEWSPPVDLFETSGHYEVVVEVAGLTRDQVQIQLQDGVLTISGERELRASCDQFHQIERGYGRFSRSFGLGEPVDEDGVTAELRDGLLTIRIPKTRPSTRTISVQ